jgi:hypothetical protein
MKILRLFQNSSTQVFFPQVWAFLYHQESFAKQLKQCIVYLRRQINYLYLYIQNDLFHRTVKQILLFGCEIWGYLNIDIIERIKLKFMKHILCVKTN